MDVPFVNVSLPSLSCLRPVKTCFTVTCPRLDENDGNNNNNLFTYNAQVSIYIFTCAELNSLLKKPGADMDIPQNFRPAEPVQLTDVSSMSSRARISTIF